MPKLKFAQRVERRLARTLLALPDFLLRLINGTPVIRDGLKLEPQVQFLIGLQKRAGKKPWYQQSVARGRRDMDFDGNLLAPASPSLAAIDNIQLDGPAGLIPARIYRPHGLGEAAPALVFCHGGGFILGSLDSHDLPCRWLAASTPCVIVAIDYRLAPEHPLPAGVDDTVAAFRAVVANAANLQIDPRRIAIGGDSAGGNLAAVAAQQLRKDAITPCFQLLVYPTTDMTMSFPSIDKLQTGFFLEKASMTWCREQYLPASLDRRDPLASPLYGEVDGLPPALVMTAGFDPLRDEGEAYAKKMADAGVSVHARRYDGLIHGFFNMSGSLHAARAALNEAAAALRDGLANTR